MCIVVFFFFKQKTAYEMRISDWSSDVCSSDLRKQPSGLNIWTCEVTGPRKSRRLHGYLLASPDALFQETPPDNPYLRLVNEAAKREDSALGGKDDDQA